MSMPRRLSRMIFICAAATKRQLARTGRLSPRCAAEARQVDRPGPCRSARYIQRTDGSAHARCRRAAVGERRPVQSRHGAELPQGLCRRSASRRPASFGCRLLGSGHIGQVRVRSGHRFRRRADSAVQERRAFGLLDGDRARAIGRAILVYDGLAASRARAAHAHPALRHALRSR